MANEINIEGSYNPVVQDVRHSTVNITQVLGHSFQYRELLQQLSDKQELFELQPENRFERRLQLSTEINELKASIERFKRDVINLAETFHKIDINTDRLRRAKGFFDRGEFGEARAVLETELAQMQTEQAHLLNEKARYEKNIRPKLINNSEEFYLLAMATRLDYENPRRFADTCQYFESSIQSFAGKNNVYNYAVFLQKHTQFKTAEKYYSQYLNDFSAEISDGEYAQVLNNLATIYSKQNRSDEALAKHEEALKIRRRLAAADASAFLPDVATSLNNLAVLHSEQNDFEKSLKEYEEALQIYRNLAETSPDIYLPDVAMTLNNLAVLHNDLNRRDEALAEYEETLRIYRKLAKNEDEISLSGVSKALANLANLHQARKENGKALKAYGEALAIGRRLVQKNPYVYLPDLAVTLNNLGILHADRNNYDEALKNYEETLKIYRDLAETDSDTFLPFLAAVTGNIGTLNIYQRNPDEALRNLLAAAEIYRELTAKNKNAFAPPLAMSLINLALFYQTQISDREKSVRYATEAMIILSPFVEKVPLARSHLDFAKDILWKWDLSDEEVSQLMEAKRFGG